MTDTITIPTRPDYRVTDRPWYQREEYASINLPYDDGDKMETGWHGKSCALMQESYIAANAHRTDFYIGANMFLYYSEHRHRHEDFRGPDIFVVTDGVDGTYDRLSWVLWEENWRSPDVIIELLSQSTEAYDFGIKKDIYERKLKTNEYFCASYHVQQLVGWRLTEVSPGAYRYRPIRPNAQGWLWSEQMGLWLGAWHGKYNMFHATWLRLYHPDGTLVLINAEREQQRAEQAEQKWKAEHQRAEQAELRWEIERQRREELEAKLKQLLENQGK